MIRVLHFSDLHLGVETYGRLDPETGLSTRLVDFLRAFDSVIDYALDNDIDLVLFAGDAFKTRDPSPTHQREFARRIRRLSRAGMPTFLLVGNHDLPNALNRATSIEIFDTLAIEHVTVAHRPGVTRLETKRGPVQIAALPWVPLSFMMAQESFQGSNTAQRNELLEEKLGRVLENLAAEIDDDLPAILAFHGTVQGAVYGSERSVLLGQDIVLPRSLLANPKYDYVALGHIHKHQCLNEQPPIVYAGSLERIDFGEAREAKGFVVAEIGDGPTRWQFHETVTRPFLQLVVDVRQSADPLATVREALAKHTVNEAVVKLVVKVAPELAEQLRDKDVRALLADAFHIAAIVRDIERPNRLRLGDAETVASLSPRELFARYLEVRQVGPERVRTLLEHAEVLWQDET
jgi:exonuclease SbcD